MLIHYSIASFEVLERRLTEAEKEEVYQVFFRLGNRMGLKELPPDYVAWLPVRDRHMEEDLEKTNYTVDLFLQYKKHLGGFRYRLLLEGQKLVIPKRVAALLKLGRISGLTPILPLYKFSRILHLDGMIKSLILPRDYKKQISDLDVIP
jgi:hypothetical protein